MIFPMTLAPLTKVGLLIIPYNLGYLFFCLVIKMKGSGVEGTAFDHNPTIHFDEILMKLGNQIDIIA